MRLTCPNCGAAYAVDAEALPPGGGHVQCSACHTRWFARAESPAPERLSEDQIIARLESRARPRLAGGTEAGPLAAPAAAPGAPIAFLGPAPTAAPAAAGADATSDPAGTPPARPGAPVGPEAVAGDASRGDPDRSAPPARDPAARAAARAPGAQAPGSTPLRPRQTAERVPRVAAAPGPAAAPKPRFLPGFATAILIGGVALGLYVRADAVAARIPVAAPAVAAYAAAVDGARAWIEARLGPLRDRASAG